MSKPETMDLLELMANYSDGDGHGWDTEFEFLAANHADRLWTLRTAIERDGIREPILLGNDGRVWDGHHRLWVAADLGMTSVPVRHAAEEPTSGPVMGPIIFHQIATPPRPPEHMHIHRWAWAYLARGGTVQVCYGCGRERR